MHAPPPISFPESYVPSIKMCSFESLSDKTSHLAAASAKLLARVALVKPTELKAQAGHKKQRPVVRVSILLMEARELSQGSAQLLPEN